MRNPEERVRVCLADPHPGRQRGAKGGPGRNAMQTRHLYRIARIRGASKANPCWRRGRGAPRLDGLPIPVLMVLPCDLLPNYVEHTRLAGIRARAARRAL